MKTKERTFGSGARMSSVVDDDEPYIEVLICEAGQRHRHRRTTRSFTKEALELLFGEDLDLLSNEELTEGVTQHFLNSTGYSGLVRYEFWVNRH